VSVRHCRGLRDYGDLSGPEYSDSEEAGRGGAEGQAASPVTMTECEGTNNCATWTFLGSQGNGQWPSGEVANLTVENFDADTVVIRRADSTGVAAGLTAVYKGTRHGDRIGGEFTSSWPGHWDGKAGNWYATIEKNSVSLPTLMHWCIDCANGMGGTLVWENGHYLNVNDVPGQTTILTVEKFTRESVVLHRTNSGRYPGSAVLTGQISAQGNSIANGIQTNPDGQTRTFLQKTGKKPNKTLRFAWSRGFSGLIYARDTESPRSRY
jgi:hypothetical protein